MIKTKLTRFLDSPSDVPLLAGCISGLYPFIFFYGNNYPSVNTWQHFLFFLAIYCLPPIAIVLLAWAVFRLVLAFRPYQKHLLFVLPVMIVSIMLSYIMYATLKKKVLLGILIVICLLSVKLYKDYKRILALIVVAMLLPIFKIGVHLYEDLRPMNWTQLPDDIASAKFKQRPNIYMIQPDGYVGRETMKKPPYAYKNDFYSWLENNKFTVYKNFRSNYPASLTSNASLFQMKHHYFDDALFPSIEMPRARKAIMNNNAVMILKNNGYMTYFLAEDEYLMQNRIKGNYDRYNINTKDIPFFTKGDKLAREVYADLETAVKEKVSKPRFVFVEKVLPHHIHFEGTGKDSERREYLAKTREANDWLKKAIRLIELYDKDAMIIILSDHGGWVGMENYDEFYTTNDENLIRSTFGNMAAIRWNGITHEGYDTDLKSAVNVFRVVFACLSENTSYLDHLEKNESYNIRYGSFFDDVCKLITEDNKIVKEKH